MSPNFDLGSLVGYAGPVVLLLAIFVFIRISGMVRYIPNSRIGIVEKLWSGKGSLKSGIIALQGEAGYQPEIRRGGFHFFWSPFTYRIHPSDLVSVPQNTIAYVYACDGKTLDATQTLASNAVADDFHDVRAFLTNGGQKGLQRKILREGLHAINLAQFIVMTAERDYALSIGGNQQKMLDEMRQDIESRDGFVPLVISAVDDQIGIVTIHDGPSLPSGEIIAPEVGTDSSHPETFHNGFQDPEKFLKAGGFRGRQLQVLTEGTYYLNRLFSTVEQIAKTIVPVGYAGVVISYTGPVGTDLTTADYKHGQLVANGCRGVRKEPLLPGKYSFNSFAGKVILVPTTSFMLKWVKGETGGHKLDENLAEISLITKDAFETGLPLSVVIHIDYTKAPEVIQRFGDVQKLVEQTLDPMVSSYFKNSGQTQTLLQLLQRRSEIQDTATQDMKTKFERYSLELQEVMIGTPRSLAGDQSIERILDQLRQREVAREQVETYKSQQEAAIGEKALNETRAIAAQQAALTASKIAIEVAQNQGSAKVELAKRTAEETVLTAEAERRRKTLDGEGEAARVKAVGDATASATKAQVDAYGGAQFRLTEMVLTRFAEAAERGRLQLVPQIQVGSTGEGGGQDQGMLGALMGLVLKSSLADGSLGQKQTSAE